VEIFHTLDPQTEPLFDRLLAVFQISYYLGTQQKLIDNFPQPRELLFKLPHFDASSEGTILDAEMIAQETS